MNLTIAIFILLCAGINLTNGYRILGVFPTQCKSHWIIGHSVMKSLAKAGHSVTIISPFPLKTPIENYNDVSLDITADNGINMFDTEEWSAVKMMQFLSQLGENLVDSTMSHPNVQKLLKTEKFDAVVVELFWVEALMGLGLHFDCPVIGLSTFSSSKWTNDLTKNPSPYSYVPHNFVSYTDEMDFYERTINTIVSQFENIYMELVHYPRQRELYNKYFRNSKISFDEQMKNVSLVFINQHFTSSSIKPSMANTIEIGGIHVHEKKPLPKNIQDYLDSADEGVVYFSMGSIIQATDWPVKQREVFVEAFGKLKQKVLWKYENETLPGNPGNIMIGSWLPQRDILAHPNVKVFITHGGLLGTTEALVEGVPVIGIPIYGDQQLNSQKAAAAGYGVVLDFNSITEESITNSLNEVLNNPRIANIAKYLSKRYSDRPMTPQKTVVYWTEYVIRHGGASHLKSTALDLSFIQLHLIDVYAVIIAIAISILTMTAFLIKLTMKKLFHKNKSTKKIKMK
ncbi:unnamed protein product [Diamesa serratosioi]